MTSGEFGVIYSSSPAATGSAMRGTHKFEFGAATVEKIDKTSSRRGIHSEMKQTQYEYFIEEKKYGMTLRVFMSACRPRKTSWERSMTVAPSEDGLQEGIRPYAWVQPSAAASCSVGSELVKTGAGDRGKIVWYDPSRVYVGSQT
ncbi:hypothetical protein K435DRAFT_836790 [Dendrothele bispora CBS 962.96]|uniref:Uncharacterized protein n=1 Tax=Dendrothele bispora (strain CBS 962.96) TaxID=1314807 RepID=A0A4S8MFQ9_DENBC|nr:hypothetical protein K435DRAFT_836790 [Dendrothele bispora CBS 962.96]